MTIAARFLLAHDLTLLFAYCEVLHRQCVFNFVTYITHIVVHLMAQQLLLAFTSLISVLPTMVLMTLFPLDSPAERIRQHCCQQLWQAVLCSGDSYDMLLLLLPDDSLGGRFACVKGVCGRQELCCRSQQGLHF